MAGTRAQTSGSRLDARKKVPTRVPTVAPVARGVGGDLTSNGLGQGFTSSTVVEPIFWVPPVLRSGAVGLPPRARGACNGRLYGPPDAFLTRIFAAAALTGHLARESGSALGCGVSCLGTGSPTEGVHTLSSP